MSAETGTIIELAGNYAQVLMTGTEACRSCAARQACITLGGTTKKIMIKNTLKAVPGDRIEFVIADKGVVLSSMIVYLVPLLFLIIGMVAGASFHAFLNLDRDIIAMLGGFAGLFLSFFIIKALNPLFKKQSLFVPQMLSILNSENNVKNINNDPSCADNK